MIIKFLLSLIKKFFFESNTYSIYTYVHQDTPEPPNPSDVEIFNKYSDIPYTIRENVLKYHLINPLYYRIQSGLATLLTIMNNSELIAYGWIQKWEPFKKKFGWVANNEAIMLGPYWTNPDYRGKGYYGQLLRKSIILSKSKVCLIIYTDKSNLASRKGIEKEGFSHFGDFKIVFVLRHFTKHYIE
jgi:hypothetical protein